jgi:hypothetical protein
MPGAVIPSSLVTSMRGFFFMNFLYPVNLKNYNP